LNGIQFVDGIFYMKKNFTVYRIVNELNLLAEEEFYRIPIANYYSSVGAEAHILSCPENERQEFFIEELIEDK